MGTLIMAMVGEDTLTMDTDGVTTRTTVLGDTPIMDTTVEDHHILIRAIDILLDQWVHLYARKTEVTSTDASVRRHPADVHRL